MKLSCPTLRLTIVIVATLCALPSPAEAHEQEARRQFLGALMQLEDSVQGDWRWTTWRSQGGLLNLTREIDAGKLANPDNVRTNIATLTKSLGGRAEMTQATNAMEAWLRTLELPASTDIVSITDTAQREVTATADVQDRLNQDLRRQIERLDRSLRSTPSSGARWRDFLFWEATTKLMGQEPLSDQTLNAMEARWTLAQTHWNTLRFRYLAQTVLRAIVLARRTMTADSAAVVEQAIQLLPNATGDLDGDAMAALLTLDRLDVASELSALWHQRHASPHFQLRIRDAALLPKFSEVVDETFPVNDYFAGTPVRGSGHIRGTMFIEPQRRATPAWNVVFQGTSTSSTIGSNSGVTVQSTANAAIRGDKTIQWRDTGLVALPATAAANAAVNFGGISAGGSRGRRNAAQSEVYASRSAAESDTEMAIRRSCIDRLNGHTQRLLQPINKRYEQTFTGPINSQNMFAPRVVVKTNGTHTAWNCWYTPVHGLSAATPPELPEDDAGWSLALHEDFLARHLTSQYAQRTVELQELARLLGAQTTPDTSSSPVLRLRATEPIEARFQDQTVYLMLHLDEFRSAQGNVTAPTTIELAYDCSVDKGKVQLSRAAAATVRIQPNEAATGRTLTLKRMLMRHLDRALPEQATLNNLASRDGSRALPSISMPIIKISITNGWLQASGEFATR